MMNIEVNGTKIQVKLYDNSPEAAVKELLLARRPWIVPIPGMTEEHVRNQRVLPTKRIRAAAFFIKSNFHK